MRTMWLALMLTLPGAAPAQSDEIIRDIAGPYRVLPIDGRPGCGIRLTVTKVLGGRQALPDASCRALIPLVASVAAWAPIDGMRLYDAGRRLTMRFEEDETTLLRSPSILHPSYYMVQGDAGLTRAPTKTNVVGRWTSSRPGRADCAIELIGSVAPARDNHPLVLGSGCKDARLPNGLRYWRLEELTLLLEGPNDAALQFEIESDDTFVGADSPWRLRRVRR